MIGLGFNESLIRCSEESESVRRIYLLLGGSWEKQENMAMSSAMDTKKMLWIRFAAISPSIE